jgi:hypothetical protein
MIVTVIAMFMVQETMHEVIVMIGMRNALVSAINMIASTLHRRTGSRILLTDGEHMLIVMLAMREVHMSIMHVINMILVLDGKMPTIGTVCMDIFPAATDPASPCASRASPAGAATSPLRKLIRSIRFAPS